ncbi:hypothetical protein TeGR_g6056 [Tetraparma gracilis]|uniref:Uncharacterized protein n=1 Tax=Tetraparma gracilis TaxID=2962635 RepID=A0ABQ6N7M3_9STRA|nr:hypothetical protein TeGR_g6056 [Tetraparma gracilis]
MGHLATDTLRLLPAAKNVGGNYGLEKDSYAFEIGSRGTTLVFTGCHPQNLLKTWTGNAVAFAGDWDDTLHRIMHYTGGNKHADTCTMKQFVEHSKAFAWTETALDLAIAVRGRELNKVRRAIHFDDLPRGLQQALETENIMSHADCAAHTLYKEGAGGKFPSAAALLLKIYNKRSTDNRVALLTQVEGVPDIELKGMSASASFLAGFNSAFFQDIVDAAAALNLTRDAKKAFNAKVVAGLKKVTADRKKFASQASKGGKKGGKARTSQYTKEQDAFILALVDKSEATTWPKRAVAFKSAFPDFSIKVTGDGLSKRYKAQLDPRLFKNKAGIVDLSEDAHKLIRAAVEAAAEATGSELPEAASLVKAAKPASLVTALNTTEETFSLSLVVSYIKTLRNEAGGDVA